MENKTPTEKLECYLKYLEGWQPKDGSSVVVEVAECAMKQLQLIKTQQEKMGELLGYIISNGMASLVKARDLDVANEMIFGPDEEG